MYQNQPLFGDFQSFLEKYDFELLNMSYNGKGTAISEFTLPNQYGWLYAADCIFVKSKEAVIEKFESEREVELLVKYATFFLINNASDIGIKYLLEFIEKYELKIYESKNCLVEFIQRYIDKLFKDLQYLPWCNIENLHSTYFKIFNKKMKVAHEYFESL